jgi:hypothetical protein
VALPEMLDALVFWTVKLRSAEAPVAMLPKLVAVDGVTLKSARATPLTELEHPPSFPEKSTAVIRPKYVAPAVKPVMSAVTVSPGAGVADADVTVRVGVPGHVGGLVPRYTR